MELGLKEAEEAFAAMMGQIPQVETRRTFLTWIDKTWIRGDLPSLPNSELPQSAAPVGSQEEICGCDTKLQKIADDIRKIVPLNSILPSEQITFPTIGENADCDPSHTTHVDAFLYDDDLVDELCDTGVLARNYCIDCSSHNTKPITYISHSISRERLAYVFRTLLPDIPEEATVLDVGSRLGAVLFGAYVYTNCRRIIGVELNADLCQIQQKIVNKYQFQDRIQVIPGDILDQGELVRSTDVLMLNNVFEFFVDPLQQAKIWRFLRATTKKGALLVSIPSLEDAFQYLEVGFLLKDWVSELEPHNPQMTAPFDHTETSEVKLYEVL